MDQRRMDAGQRSGAFSRMHEHQLGRLLCRAVDEAQIGDRKLRCMQYRHELRQLLGIVTEEKVASGFDDAVYLFDHRFEIERVCMLAQTHSWVFASVCTAMVVGGIGEDEIELFVEIVRQKIIFDHLRFAVIDSGILGAEEGVVWLDVDHRELDGKISGGQQSYDTAACAYVEQIAFGCEARDEIVEEVCVRVEEKSVTLLIEIQSINLFLLPFLNYDIRLS